MKAIIKNLKNEFSHNLNGIIEASLFTPGGTITSKEELRYKTKKKALEITQNTNEEGRKFLNTYFKKAIFLASYNNGLNWFYVVYLDSSNKINSCALPLKNTCCKPSFFGSLEHLKRTYPDILN